MYLQYLTCNIDCKLHLRNETIIVKIWSYIYLKASSNYQRYILQDEIIQKQLHTSTPIMASGGLFDVVRANNSVDRLLARH